MRPPAGDLFEAGVSEGTGLPRLFAQALTRQDRSQLGVCRHGFWQGCPGEGRRTARPGHRFPCCSLPRLQSFSPPPETATVSRGVGASTRNILPLVGCRLVKPGGWAAMSRGSRRSAADAGTRNRTHDLRVTSSLVQTPNHHATRTSDG